MFSAVGLKSTTWTGSPSRRISGRAGSSLRGSMRIDPAADDALDLREIHDHAELVEPGRLKRDDGPAVVSVQVPALAVVFEEPMAVAESKFARDEEHVDHCRRVIGPWSLVIRRA